MLQGIPCLVCIVETKDLKKEIEEEEFIDVIWGLEPNKVPSPYRFSIHFYCDF
jgi:hypothetical protein